MSHTPSLWSDRLSDAVNVNDARLHASSAQRFLVALYPKNLLVQFNNNNKLMHTVFVFFQHASLFRRTLIFSTPLSSSVFHVRFEATDYLHAGISLSSPHLFENHKFKVWCGLVNDNLMWREPWCVSTLKSSGCIASLVTYNLFNSLITGRQLIFAMQVIILSTDVLLLRKH